MVRFFKVFSILLFAFSLLATSTFAAGVEKEKSDVKDDDTVVITQTRDLTYEEAVQVLVEKAGMSVAEAEEQLGSDIGIACATGCYIYREHYSIQDFGMDTAAEYGFLAKIYVYNSFRNYSDIEATWAIASGSGPHTFTEAYHYQDFSPARITDFGRGTIEIAVTYSSSREADIGVSEFLSAGFSVSKQTGLTYYFRKTQSFSKTYSLY